MTVADGHPPQRSISDGQGVAPPNLGVAAVANPYSGRIVDREIPPFAQAGNPLLQLRSPDLRHWRFRRVGGQRFAQVLIIFQEGFESFVQAFLLFCCIFLFFVLRDGRFW